MISDDERFLFDNQGYLHLRRALPSEEIAASLRHDYGVPFDDYNTYGISHNG